ncbi:MAG TPA: recombinase family protein [bacterium]|nr:recombinase family protein [bacterium]
MNETEIRAKATAVLDKFRDCNKFTSSEQQAAKNLLMSLVFGDPYFTGEKTVMYNRKSNESDDKQKASLFNQLSENVYKAIALKLVIIDIYFDSYSAKMPGRPVFDEMVTKARASDCAILANHPDRLARNPVDGGKLIHDLNQRESGVKNTVNMLHFTSFPFTNDAAQRMLLSVIFAQTSYYSDNLGREVTKGVYGQFLKGYRSGTPKVGYINKDKKTHADPDNFNKVKKLLVYFLEETHTIDEATKYAEKTLQLRSKSGGAFKRSHIHEIITDVFYAGVLTPSKSCHAYAQKRGLPDPIPKADCHDAMITIDQHRKILEILARGCKGFRTRRHKSDNYTYKFDFISCGCGGTIWVGYTTKKHRDGTVKYHMMYRCEACGISWKEAEPVKSQRGHGRAAHPDRLPLDVMILRDVIRPLQLPPGVSSLYRDREEKAQRKMTDGYVRERTRLTGEIKRIESLRQKGYTDALTNPANMVVFQQMNGLWDKELNDIKNKIDEIDRANSHGRKESAIFLNLLQHAERLWNAANQELRREILQLVVLNLTFNATSIGVTYKSPFAEVAKGAFGKNGRHGRT